VIEGGERKRERERRTYTQAHIRSIINHFDSEKERMIG
jgi:hypothetical protein